MSRILVVDDSSTVLKVVERTLTAAGFEVVLATDGQDGFEKAQQQPPDLVLVDFVMPKMNGFQMCQALRGVANLRRVPVVLMSAKADRIADQFLGQTGAVDAISKPFSPEALLAVTAHALARGPAREPSTAGTLEAPSDDDAPFPRPSSPPPREISGQFSIPPEALEAADAALHAERAAARAEFAARLAQAVLPAIDQAGGRVEAAALATALADRIDAEDAIKLVRELRLLAPRVGVISFEGRLDHVGLGDVLQMVQMQQQTGVLEIERGVRTISVCLREGLVDLAIGRGSDPEHLLGRYLLEEEVVDKEDLDQLLRSRQGRGLLGDQLVKLGYITPDDLRAALVRQSSELVYEALRWRTGRFRFERLASRPEARAAQLRLPIASILMEGLRRVDEWRLIEEQIPDFDRVLVQSADALAQIDVNALSREERLVLAAVDGQRTVRQVVAHVGMGSFDVSKVLFQFATTRLIRERR